MEPSLNILKTASEITKPDNVEEIHALQSSPDVRLQRAGEYEADSKEKIAFIKNAGISLLYDTVSIFTRAKSKIRENLSLLNPDVEQSLGEKISNIGEQNIKLDSLPTLASATENLVYAQEEPNLREMYENLIANTVDKTKEDIIHPAYVEVLKQLSQLDAYYLKELFSAPDISIIPICNIKQIVNEDRHYRTIRKNLLPPSMHGITIDTIENWERLKLVEISFEEFWTDDTLYSYGSQLIELLKAECPEINLELYKGQFVITEFGKRFARAIGIFDLSKPSKLLHTERQIPRVAIVAHVLTTHILPSPNAV
ncbi:DUF4393 domain-containing protein [Bergeriella denitrificans]|nr:DUF4393 domain-containing protein [Bergeriella denitrificans]